MVTWLWFAAACTGDPDPAPDPAEPPEATGDTGADTVSDTGGCPDGFADADGDGYGDPSRPVTCEDPSAVLDGTDCDDADPAVHPGASEHCDRSDSDCDPSTGEDGLVTLVTPGGALLDLTSTFVAGTAESPAVMDLVDGTYDLCAGTWYMRLRGLQTTTTIDGHGVATLDGGRDGTVIALDGGTVAVVDLTVTGGQGSVPNAVGLTGGGLACYGGATLTVGGSTFVDNAAEIGGGWFVGDCTLTATATTLTGNAATYGGGMYAFDGDVSLVGSTVAFNTATISGGGLGVEGTGPRPVLTFTDTVVSDNVATFGGGLVTYENAEATCIGSVGVAGGFFRNTATGSGGAVYVTGADFPPRFVADVCDFGLGADDNLPTDVETAYATLEIYAAGDDASFSCDATGCL